MASDRLDPPPTGAPRARHVRGVLFLDYVRMLRSQRGVDWAAQLEPADAEYLTRRIDRDAWYPMATFERLGNQILRVVTRGELYPVQLWGRYSAAPLCASHPLLLALGDPVETINRFRVLRETFFDFVAVEIAMLHDDAAYVDVGYHMGMPAEAAAAHQTLGFFEGLLHLAGARDIDGELLSRAWVGEPRTRLALRWRSPGA
jgi:hypothetical protein